MRRPSRRDRSRRGCRCRCNRPHRRRSRSRPRSHLHRSRPRIDRRSRPGHDPDRERGSTRARSPSGRPEASRRVGSWRLPRTRTSRGGSGRSGRRRVRPRRTGCRSSPPRRRRAVRRRSRSGPRRRPEWRIGRSLRRRWSVRSARRGSLEGPLHAPRVHRRWRGRPSRAPRTRRERDGPHAGSPAIPERPRDGSPPPRRGDRVRPRRCRRPAGRRRLRSRSRTRRPGR